MEVLTEKGGSQVRSVHEDQTVEFQLDPVSKKFIKDGKLSKGKEKVPEFIVKPRRQFVNEGQTAKFKCSFDGSPQTSLTWSKDGTPLSPGKKYKVYEEGDLHWLDICDVTSEDVGSYTCLAHNSAGSCKEKAELDVYVKPTTGTKKSGFVAPKVDIPLCDLHVTPGDRNVTLECKFSNAIDASASWFKDGRLLTSGFLSKQSFDGRLARLIINRVAIKDSGSYECVVSNTGGEAKTKASLTVIVPGTRSIPPKFVNPLSNLTLKEGEKLVYEAKVTGYPKPTINWYKDGKIIRSGKTLTTEFDGSTVRLVMAKVTKTDGAIYKCIAENEAGKDQIKSTLTVEGSSDAAVGDFREPPKFVRELHDIEVDDGDTVELAVEVKGMHPIRLVWFHNKKEVLANDPVLKLVSHGDSHSLIIPECVAEDAGSFVCEAYNDVGRCETCCRLRVKDIEEENQEEDIVTNINTKTGNYLQIDEHLHEHKNVNVDPVHRENKDDLHSFEDDKTVLNNSNGGDCLRHPEFVLKPQISQVEEGKSAIFLCRGTGTPIPTAYWSRQGEIIQNKGRYKVSTGEDNVLEIKTVTLSDADKYTCTLTNQAGSVSIETNLTVIPRKVAQTDFRSVLRTSSQQPKNGTSNFLTSDKNSKEKSGVYNFRKVLTNKQDKITTDTQPKSQIVSNYTDVLKKNKTSTQSENIKKRSTSPKLEATRTQNLDHIGNVKLESNKSNKPMETKTFRTVLKPSRVSDIGSEHGGKSGIKQGENNIDFRSVLKKTGNVPNIGKSVNPSAKTLKQTNSNQIDFRHVLQTRKDGESGKQSDNVTATDYSVHRQQKSKITSFVKEPIRPESLRMKDSEHSAKIVFTKGVRESHLEQDSKNGATYLNKEQIQSLPEVPPKPKRTQKIEKMLNQLDEATDEILAMGSNPTSIKSINREITENNDAHPAKQIWIGQTSEFVTIDEKSEPEFQLMNTPTKLHEKFSHESENLNLSKVEIKSGSIEDSEPRQIYTAEFSPTTTVVENSDNVEIVPNITQSTDINVPNNSTNSSICSNNILSDENENKIQKPKNRNVLLRLNSQEKLPVLSRSVDKRPRQHPVFKSSLKDITVAEGSCVTMECEVFGIPRPEITWFMNNNRIKPSKFFQMTHEEDLARLVIEGAYPEDDGDYMCTASNVVGIETQTCHLFVTESSGTSTDQTGDEQEDEEDFLYGVPEIHEISPTSLSVKRGKKVDVLASFSAETQAQVIWLKEKIPIQLGNRFCVVTCENSSCLTIYNVELEDSGTYDVLVETCHGEDTRSMTISVEDVPDKPVGHPYASEATLRSVILSWCGPAYDGGSPVTNYKIEICDAEERVWRLLSDKCHSTSYKATDLTPHTPYFFRVSAVNKHGTGQPSETPEVVVTKDQRPDMRLSVESDEEEDLPAPFSPRIVSVRKDDSFDDFYILKGELGKGKFGSVYQCIEKCDGATWAAKILKCRAKDKAIIYNEISVMNELTHPKLLMLRDAFETARSIILVMEYVGGGELFERVVNEDFELTERDCVHFLRQICEGVQYMHSKHIVHLDLKPENILCVRNDSNLIKIIDFGLARFHKPGESLRAMVGTPEFVAPEIVNFEEIGFPTDIWSLGVICYVLLSGLSPFMGDSDTETLANVTRGEFDFDDDAFLEISGNAKDFIQCSLQKNPRKRMSINDCLHHRWLEKAEKISSRKLRQSLRNLKQFIARRKWQKMGTAIRAIGRMSSLQKLFKHGEGSGNDKNSTHSNSYSDTASQSELSPLELKSSEKVEEILQESKSSSGIEEDRGQSSTSSSTTEDRLQMQTTDDINLNNNVFKKPITDKSDSTSVCDIESTKLQIQENSLTSLSSIPSTISEDGSPQFLQEMVDCEAFTGDVIRFDVQVNGSPEPSVEWFREDTTIQADSRHTLRCGDNGDYSLIIRNVTEDDDAEYSCKASNSLGEVTCTAELIICGTGAF